MRQLTITRTITPHDNEVFNMYARSIRNYDVLTQDEEMKLIEQIRKGHPGATDKLIKHNLRFVISVAKKYQSDKLDLNDLIEEGNIGLINAARNFDPNYSNRFISYAVYHIRQAIQQGIVSWGNVIRLPENKLDLQHDIRTFENHFTQLYEYAPSDREIADALSIDTKTVQQLRSASKTTSLDVPAGEDKDMTLANLLADNTVTDTDGSIEKESLRKRINLLLSLLTPREREIMTLRFGLSDEQCNGMSIASIAEQLNCSNECIRKTLHRAVEKIRSSRMAKAA